MSETHDSACEHLDGKTKWEIPVVALIVLGCLVPFLGKPFNMDDPLFIWVARHIQSHPLNPFGFEVNWYTHVEPMWKVTMNPPLASYYIALVGLLGWNEVLLHSAFLLPALGAALGTYLLAKRLTRYPFIGTLVALLTPVFLVSGSSVMCDVMMLGFWVWAIYLWMLGVHDNRHAFLLLSSVLMGLCALTKYFGMSLLPLVFLYSIISKCRARSWIGYLLIPVAILTAYYYWTKALYGSGLLVQAASYTKATRELHGAEFSWKLVVALTFTGGCALTALFYTPLLWSKRVLEKGVFLLVVILVCGQYVRGIGGFTMPTEPSARWSILSQLVIMLLGGLSVLGLAVDDVWKRRDAGSVLLFSWVIGVFIFAAFMNWTVNGRSILPMMPAVGLLVARRLEIGDIRRRRYLTALPLVLSAAVSLFVTWADAGLAQTARTAATTIARKYGNKQGNLWFEGHWGFQYYMEREGGKALDVRRSRLEPGDLIVIATNNCNIYPIPPAISKPLDTIAIRSPIGVSTMNRSVGAGFYSDAWGPLPFGFGAVADEKYEVLSIVGRHQAPFTAVEHRKLGREAAERGDFGTALGHFREAVAMSPDDPDAYIDLGVAYAQSGNMQAAIAAFKEAVRLEPQYPAAHYNLATALFQAKELDGAIRELKKVLELDPSMVSARNNLASVLIMKGRYDEAADQVRILQEHGAEVRPDVLQALSSRGRHH